MIYEAWKIQTNTSSPEEQVVIEFPTLRPTTAIVA